MSTAIASNYRLFNAAPAASGFTAPAAKPVGTLPGMPNDTARFTNAPATAATCSPACRQEMAAMQQQLAMLARQLENVTRQLQQHIVNDKPCHCPCFHNPFQGNAPVNPWGPAAVPPNLYQTPAWCRPGDPTCDPNANPLLIRPTWCKPGDPTCDPAVNPALARPSWCTPGDPTCDPAARQPQPTSILRPVWCTPGDPSCDPAANPSLLRPSWCKPGDPTCDPAANPALLRPYWCKPGDPTCDPAANPALLRHLVN